MKVLYLGHYRDGTGWANAAIHYILGLDHAGVDVVCRPIKLNNYKGPIPERIEELEAKSIKGCDVVIQNVLPHLMEYDSRFFNIGFPFIESTIRYTPWVTPLNTMDKLWVANERTIYNLVTSGCDTPCEVLRPPLNPSDYENIEPVYLPTNGNFVFYTIGELTRRKNFVTLIKAFQTEFEKSEPVSLVIKTNKYGKSEHEVAEEMKNMCLLVRQQLKKYHDTNDYHHEIIISNHIDHKSILGIHALGDCFITTSYGEGLCLPACDAMMMGNPCVLPDHLDMGMGHTTVFSSSDVPCSGETETFDYLFTSRDYWRSPKEINLQTNMRLAYEEHQTNKDQHIECMKVYDYEDRCSKLKKGLSCK